MTPYHPASDGLVERFNITLMMLAMFAGENRDNLLPAVMMAYRSSVHESTGFSPYRLICGEELHCLWTSVFCVRIRTHPLSLYIVRTSTSQWFSIMD